MNKPKMTQSRALRLIKINRPENLLEASNLGLKLVHIGSGSYRKVYRVKDTDLVIKFPEAEDWSCDGKQHSKAEAARIKKLYKYKSLRPHLPKIYFHDPKSGVLVTKYYERYNKKRAEVGAYRCKDISWERGLICRMMEEMTGVAIWDLYDDNLRLDNNEVKFIDIAI